MTPPPTESDLTAIVKARIEELERKHGTAESCGDHLALEYQYDMEAAAALHELKWVLTLIEGEQWPDRT